MVIGTALIVAWIWFLANYQNLPIAEIKQLLLLFGIGVIFLVIELVWEVKAGFKVVGKILFKLIIFPFKKMKEKKLMNKLLIKLKNGTPTLNKKELKLFKKLKEKKEKIC